MALIYTCTHILDQIVMCADATVAPEPMLPGHTDMLNILLVVSQVPGTVSKNI